MTKPKNYRRKTIETGVHRLPALRSNRRRKAANHLRRLPLRTRPAGNALREVPAEETVVVEQRGVAA